MEDGFLEVSKDADGREKVVEVRLEWIGRAVGEVIENLVANEGQRVGESGRGRGREAGEVSNLLRTAYLRVFLELSVSSEVLMMGQQRVV